MARHRRSSRQGSGGSDSHNPWDEYADSTGIPDDPEWADDEGDPLDGRPLPRRRRRRGQIARVLAWIGGAALLMALGGVLALVAWPRSPASVSTLAAARSEPDTSPISAATAPSAIPDAAGGGGIDPRRPAGVEGGAGEQSEPAAGLTGSGVDLAPPPLPPLPPGLEAATPEAPSSTQAAVEPPEPASAPRPEPAKPPRAVQPVAPPSPPPADRRTSQEIMADFLLSRGDSAQARASARAYAEWYPAGSAERAYWLGVLGTIGDRQ